MRRSRSPAVVDNVFGRVPLRCATRSGLRSHRPAPITAVALSTSNKPSRAEEIHSHRAKCPFVSSKTVLTDLRTMALTSVETTTIKTPNSTTSRDATQPPQEPNVLDLNSNTHPA